MIERNGVAQYCRSTAREWLSSNAASRDRSGHLSTTRYAAHILKNEVFPHIGMEEDPGTERRKAEYVGFVVRGLLAVGHGHRSPDDRDHNNCKRLDAAGSLLAMLFRQLWRAHLKHAKLQLSKVVEQEKGWLNVVEFVSSRRIEVGWRYHFSTATGA